MDVGVVSRVQSIYSIKDIYATAVVPVDIGVIVILKRRVPWDRYRYMHSRRDAILGIDIRSGIVGFRIRL